MCRGPWWSTWRVSWGSLIHRWPGLGADFGYAWNDEPACDSLSFSRWSRPFLWIAAIRLQNIVTTSSRTPGADRIHQARDQRQPLVLPGDLLQVRGIGYPRLPSEMSDLPWRDTLQPHLGRPDSVDVGQQVEAILELVERRRLRPARPRRPSARTPQRAPAPTPPGQTADTRSDRPMSHPNPADAADRTTTTLTITPQPAAPFRRIPAAPNMIRRAPRVPAARAILRRGSPYPAGGTVNLTALAHFRWWLCVLVCHDRS